MYGGFVDYLFFYVFGKDFRWFSVVVPRSIIPIILQYMKKNLQILFFANFLKTLYTFFKHLKNYI